jgi:hypothetical protein
MTTADRDARFSQLMARLDVLEQELASVKRENVQLCTHLAALEQHRYTPAADEAKGSAGTRVSRRSVLGGALGAAATTIGAGVALEAANLRSAAAASGSAIVMGLVNQEEGSTEVRYDGGTALNGVLLLANDGTSAASTTTYKAALGGWAAGGAAHTTTGVYGLSNVTGGNGVVGSDTSAGTSGTGVYGLSASGVGVYGSSNSGFGLRGDSNSGYGLTGGSTSSIGMRAGSTSNMGLVATSASTAANMAAVLGMLTTTTAGASSSAVRGQNNDTTANGIGVYGSQAGSGQGVFGNAPSGTGVAGSSTSGTGVLGSSGTGIGVSGTSASTAGGAAAIRGTITSTTPGGFSAGVYGQNNGTGSSGIGVYGVHNGSGYGVYGTTPSGSGVYGYSSSGHGLHGDSSTGTGAYVSSTGGVGLDGHSSSNTAVQGTSGSGSGVKGTSSSSTGVQGISGSGGGVKGTSNSSTGVQGISGSGIGTRGDSTNNYGVAGVSTSGNGVYGQVSAAAQAGVVGRQQDASGNFAVFGFGNIAATGTKSALVPAENGAYRKLYCMESPECWFEDFGVATLTGGSAQVALDPLFAGTVLTTEYYVFLVPEGDCKGLFVGARSATGFSVRELQGGTSTLQFSYRIVARRKDVAAPRLALVTAPQVPTARPAPEPEVPAPVGPPTLAQPRSAVPPVPVPAPIPATPVVPPAIVVPPLPAPPQG